MRITKVNITELEPNQVFVFGSNLSGIHGGGAALTARKWGAELGNGVGLQGQTYAIPTKDKEIRRTLDVEEIKPYVDEFISFAKNNTDKIFLVTEIGCGLAGHHPSSISPLFQECKYLDNVHLPLRFWKQ